MSETKSDVLLEVKNLHKAFDKHVVLDFDTYELFRHLHQV